MKTKAETGRLRSNRRTLSAFSASASFHSIKRRRSCVAVRADEEPADEEVGTRRTSHRSKPGPRLIVHALPTQTLDDRARTRCA